MIVTLLKIIIRDITFEKKKTRNFIARDLFSTKYKKRVIRPKKGKGSFKRKKR